MQSRFTPTLWLRIFTFQLLFIGLCAAGFGQTEPAGILLTWQEDPTTTISIDWHTLPEDETIETVHYRSKGATEWQRAHPQSFPFPYSDRKVHRIELTDLKPDSNYEFRVGEFERTYSFRTLAATNIRPLRFAAGGDTSLGEMFGKMNRAAMRYNPDFIVWGGDLAYANGDKENVGLWYHQHFLMINENGKIIDEYPETLKITP